MGISKNAKSDFKINIEFEKPIWENPKVKEVEISADDENLIWTDDGIYYQGRRVILYIRDINIYYGEVQEPKFHLTWCQTLKRMHSQGRYAKYVVAIRVDKKFKLNYMQNNEIVETVEKELDVCKHCLQALNWKGYNFATGTRKNHIYENFSVEEFFKSVDNDNQKNFSVVPEHTDISAPPNIYPPTWNIISKMLRTEAGYICSDCGKEILESGKLHVHHINGIKNDCSRANLEVLCADCHQKKHNHKIFGGSRNKDNAINLFENF